MTRALFLLTKYRACHAILITNFAIEFGVTCNPAKLDGNSTIVESFLSSTKRTVGVVLDLNAGTLNFWMNSRVLKKNKQRLLKKPGVAWYPFLKFQEPNIHAILNPFCRMPVLDNTNPKFKSKLPYQLTSNDLGYAQFNYLKSQMPNTLLVACLAKRTDEEQQKYLKDKLPGS